MMSRPLLVASSLLLAASVSAAGPVERVSLVNTLKANPSLRAEVVRQIDALKAGPMAPNPVSIKEAQARTAALYIVAHQEQLGAAPLAEVLGEQGVAALASVPTDLARSIASGMDESDLAVHIAATFDGSAAAAPSQAAVVAPATSGLSEAHELAKLKRHLKETLSKPLIERTIDQDLSHRPTVGFASLSGPLGKLDIFRQGGRQTPGDGHMILHPDWMEQRTLPDGSNVTFIKKALTFDADGQPVLVTYKKPRLISYFANFLTLGAFDTDAGVPFETRQAAPMSSSSRLEKVTNDKLLQLNLYAANGARVPATLAFFRENHPFMRPDAKIPQSDAVKYLPMQDAAQAESTIRSFMSKYKKLKEMVVKPSGARFHSGYGVKFFDAKDAAGMAGQVRSLAVDAMMDDQGAALVTQRLAAAPVYLRFGADVDPAEKDHGFVYQMTKDGARYLKLEIIDPREIAQADAREKKDVNLRVFAGRTKTGDVEILGMPVVRAGPWGKPTSALPKDPRDAAVVMKFEDLVEAIRRQTGLLKTDAEVQELLSDIRRQVRLAMKASMEHEKTLTRGPDDPLRDQTDMMGFDIMLNLEGRKLVPYIIEGNDHDSTMQYMQDLYYPNSKGEHTRVWWETMIDRGAEWLKSVKGLLGVGSAADTAAEGIARQDAKLKEWNASEKKTIVAFYSQSDSSYYQQDDFDQGVLGLEFYDSRPLAQVLLAADKNVDFIFVTDQPVDPALVKHVLRSRPDADEIIKRIQFVNVGGKGKEFLSKKILAEGNRAVLNRVRRLVSRSVAQGSKAILWPYVTTQYEWKVAEALGIPDAVYGAHPSLVEHTGKTGNRRILKRASEALEKKTLGAFKVGVADGEEGIYDLESLKAAIEALKARHPGLTKVMAKLNWGTSGSGNAKLDLTKDVKAQLEAFTIGHTDPKNFIDIMSFQGAAVEKFMDGYAKASYPSAQAEILPDGSVKVWTTHEQILQDGLEFVGSRYPAKESYRKALESYAQEVGKEMARLGIRGPFGIDFAAVPKAGQGAGVDLFAVEINIRMTGTMHPRMAATGLTGAALDKDGLLRAPNGKPVVYKSMDHDVRRNLIGMDVKPFLDFFERRENADIQFDPKTGRGVLFHLLPAVKLVGNVGYTIVAENAAEADKIQERLSGLLDQLEIESVAGRKQPGEFRYEQKVASDAREALSARLGHGPEDKRFKAFLQARGPQFDAKKGEGIVFHPHGYTVIARDARAFSAWQRRAHELLAAFAAEAR